MSEIDKEVGRVDPALVNHAPAGHGPTGFDPARGATLTVANDAYSPFWRHTIIGQILDIQERENASREDFQPAISREMVERAADALFGIYDCRSSDFAAVYAWTGFWTALAVDWRKLTFLPCDSGRLPEGEDPKGLSAEQARAAAQPHRPTSPSLNQGADDGQ